jgi:hypothetical protein
MGCGQSVTTRLSTAPNKLEKPDLSARRFGYFYQKAIMVQQQERSAENLANKVLRQCDYQESVREKQTPATSSPALARTGSLQAGMIGLITLQQSAPSQMTRSLQEAYAKIFRDMPPRFRVMIAQAQASLQGKIIHTSLKHG